MSLSFKKNMYKVIVFLFLSNNILNITIYSKSPCSGKKSNGYSGKNKNEYEKLNTQDTSTTVQKAGDKSKESEESELKEKQIEKEKQKQKEFEEQKQLESSKQNFTTRFNKIYTEIVNLINHKNNKFGIKKEEKLKVTLDEINELKFEEIENFEKKIEESENNFKGLITNLVSELKTKFDNLKKKETNTIKLDIEENNFINLNESSKIIKIDNKLTNFEKAITDGKDGILKDLIPIYNNLLHKEKKINILVTEEKYKFDFKTNTLDLIKTKEIAELLEIKTKLDNLKSIYDGIINKKSNDSKIKYSNLNTIITNYNKFFTDSPFEISEINKEEFKFENYEEKYEEIDKNITNIEIKLNNEFNDKLVALNNERNEIIEKLESFNVSVDHSDYNFKEDKDLNNKLIVLRSAKQSIDNLKEFLDEKIKDKKDDCTDKLNAIKKDKSDDILNVFNDKFNEILDNINSLENNEKYKDIIKAIEDLQKEITEKIEEEKKKKEIEDFINKYKDKKITNYNDFEKAFSSVKNIYDNINEENEDITKTLKYLIEEQDLEINKLFSYVGNSVKLGKGGFGVVFKWTRGKDEFALKIITPKDEFNIELTKKEIKYLLLFKGYKNMLQIKDAYSNNNNKNFFLSTEYYENGSLTDNLNKLTYEEIIKIMYELIIALKNIHKNGVIHRDIKTGNIFLDKKNKAYIGDFGMADIGDIQMVECGTLFYLPPYMYKSKYSRKKLDLYALLLCFISMIEKIKVGIDENKLKKRISSGNYIEYNDMSKIRDFDSKYVKGIYDIFEQVFLKTNYNLLDWNNFLKTNFYKNLEKKYKEINNK